jgi:hypothetical protein
MRIGLGIGRLGLVGLDMKGLVKERTRPLY